MLMLTGMIVLAIFWFGVVWPLAWLYWRWRFRNWDTMTEWEQRELLGLEISEADHLERERWERERWEAACREKRWAARRLKSDRRWEAKQRVKWERWFAIEDEKIHRAELKHTET